MGSSKAEQLRQLLAMPGVLSMPSVYDAMSAKLVERAGFKASFMGGFAVSASRLGVPDTGLISYTEMLDQGRNICGAVDIPVIGDGDTGYGNAINARRTVQGYAQAGFACVMIEDQVAPKRCGHTRGKQTVARGEALARVQAAVDARDEGADILIMARTDAAATDGFEEALVRAKAFAEIGVDITFLEAPRSLDDMRRYCDEVPGHKMANMVEQGDTPYLSAQDLNDIGYKIAIYPLTLLLASIHAMEQALAAFARGEVPKEGIADFAHLQEIIGFPEYYEMERRYASS
ncbi:MAG: isocitrate lyase/PEP mutase family protein [Gammaproteobacteria bacterium]